jgi:hypothetical protein
MLSLFRILVTLSHYNGNISRGLGCVFNTKSGYGHNDEGPGIYHIWFGDFFKIMAYAYVYVPYVPC